jgi:adenylate cyclase
LAEFERASDAIPAALAFQAEQANNNAQLNDHIQPKLRVGIALGEVIVADNTVTGAGVVLAQRVEQLAEHGGVCITGAIHEALPQRMPFEQENLGEQKVKGFEETVRVYRVTLRPGEVIPPPENTHKPKASNTLGISAAVAAIVLLVTGGLAFWFQPWSPEEEPASVERMAFPLPDKPSIAVLPFDNLSGKPDQEHLVDGLTEEIITTLSKSPNLFVIARNSTFTYKGKAVEVRQVAEEQGVHYVLEGSVQRSGDRIRINAQLIDALEGHHIWAESYDREFDDIFALQDDITQNIMIELEVELTQGEELREIHSRAPSSEVFVYMQKSRAHYYRFNKEDNAIAREMAKKAAEISPDYPDAWEWMGWHHLADFRFGWSADRQNSFERAEELADKAYKLDPAIAGTNMLLGALSLYSRQHDEAISYFRKAVELAPSNANAIATLAWGLCYEGSPEEAIPLLNQAMRLSPVYPAWYAAALGLAYMMNRDFPKAIAAHEQLIERKSLLQFAYSRLAAIYAVQDNEEKARAYAAELLKIKPDFTVSGWSKALIYQHQENLDWELDALRKAGLPENPPLELPDKPSIAVLPFTNLTGDPEQDYFVDGFTNEIITNLSKFPEFFVIASNSVFTYKDNAVRINEVGRELGVRYVLEGSLQRSNNNISVHAQLIEAANENHIWAETYEVLPEEIFAVQKDVTQQIVATLAQRITDLESAAFRTKDDTNLAAYELYLKGWKYRFGKKPFEEAIGLLERAIALDPEYMPAYSTLASRYLALWRNRLADDPDEALKRARQAAQKAIALDQQDYRSHWTLGQIFLWADREHELALAEYEKALAFNPNQSDLMAMTSTLMSYMGRAEDAVHWIEKAMRLDPFHPVWYDWIGGFAYFMARDYEKAVLAEKKTIAVHPKNISARRALIAAYVEMGRMEDAQQAAGEILKIDPEFRLSEVRSVVFQHKADHDRYFGALAKAGLPE